MRGVVRWLFGCGLVLDGFYCAIVLSFLAMPGLCCFLQVKPVVEGDRVKARTRSRCREGSDYMAPAVVASGTHLHAWTES